MNAPHDWRRLLLGYASLDCCRCGARTMGVCRSCGQYAVDHGYGGHCVYAPTTFTSGSPCVPPAMKGISAALFVISRSTISLASRVDTGRQITPTMANARMPLSSTRRHLRRRDAVVSHVTWVYVEGGMYSDPGVECSDCHAFFQYTCCMQCGLTPSYHGKAGVCCYGPGFYVVDDVTHGYPCYTESDDDDA